MIRVRSDIGIVRDDDVIANKNRSFTSGADSKVKNLTRIRSNIVRDADVITIKNRSFTSRADHGSQNFIGIRLTIRIV